MVLSNMFLRISLKMLRNLRGGGARPRRIMVTHVTGPTLHAAMLFCCADEVASRESVSVTYVTVQNLHAGISLAA